LNKEGKALNHVNGLPGVDPLKDTRVVAKTTLTTTLWKSLSIAFSFSLRYDQNPAPLPLPAGATPPNTPAFMAFSGTGGTPLVQTTDTQTEATLIYTFF